MQIEKEIITLINRYPQLEQCRLAILEAFYIMEESFSKGGKLLIAGNGGSAADSQHLVGELMKRFRAPRPIGADLSKKLISIDASRGEKLSKALEKGLTAISLVENDALSTAYINDVDGDGDGVFAQQVLGYGYKDDVFLGISTSGNSENILCATIVAKALGMKTIGLTGKSGGALLDYSDVVVRAPETETYLIQELHLPIYHWWARVLEDSFFVQKRHAK